MQVETVGESADIYEGAREGTKGCSTKGEDGAEARDSEKESLGREESLFTFYQRDLLHTCPLGIRRSVVSMNQPQQRKEEPQRQVLHPACLWYIPPVLPHHSLTVVA